MHLTFRACGKLKAWPAKFAGLIDNVYLVVGRPICILQRMTRDELRGFDGSTVNLRIGGCDWLASLSHPDGLATLWNFRPVGRPGPAAPPYHYLTDAEVETMSGDGLGVLVASTDLALSPA